MYNNLYFLIGNGYSIVRYGGSKLHFSFFFLIFFWEGWFSSDYWSLFLCYMCPFKRPTEENRWAEKNDSIFKGKKEKKKKEQMRERSGSGERWWGGEGMVGLSWHEMLRQAQSRHGGVRRRQRGSTWIVVAASMALALALAWHHFIYTHLLHRLVLSTTSFPVPATATATATATAAIIHVWSKTPAINKLFNKWFIWVEISFCFS